MCKLLRIMVNKFIHSDTHVLLIQYVECCSVEVSNPASYLGGPSSNLGLGTLTENFCGIPQSLQLNAETVP
jgi:hypothetical protein